MYIMPWQLDANAQTDMRCFRAGGPDGVIDHERVSQFAGGVAGVMIVACRCAELKSKIEGIEDGEYATAKRECDALRAELGQPPLPNLQALLEEKSAA